jgi:hypothetical protein
MNRKVLEGNCTSLFKVLSQNLIEWTEKNHKKTSVRIAGVPAEIRTTEYLPLFFFNSHSGGVESNWVHSARRPLNGLLYLPRVIMMMENLVE